MSFVSFTQEVDMNQIFICYIKEINVSFQRVAAEEYSKHKHKDTHILNSQVCHGRKRKITVGNSIK
jgi:hypothetical protein